MENLDGRFLSFNRSKSNSLILKEKAKSKENSNSSEDNEGKTIEESAVIFNVSRGISGLGIMFSKVVDSESEVVNKDGKIGEGEDVDGIEIFLEPAVVELFFENGVVEVGIRGG